MKKTLLASSIAAITLGSSLHVQASSFDDVVTGSTLDLDFRFRTESVDIDNGNDTTIGNTLKSRLTFKSGEYAGFSVLIEGDNVFQITDDFFDGGENGTGTDKNLILDQETTQFNQALVQYKGFNSTIKLGNQRINLDNQRHVGGVAWRQDEATFDAISINNTSIENTTIFAAFADNLNNIKNDNVEADITLLNVKHQLSNDLAASAFFYEIEPAAGGKLDTFGLRATGTISGFGYEAEIATQDNEVNDTLYYHFNASTKLGDIKTTLGYEVMGSDNGEASFNTPLGTNHKFLGWSDAYLSAQQWGANGIEDIYLSAVTKVSGVKLVGQLHSFSANEGSADLGTEIGFLAAKKFSDNYGGSIKIAQLSGSDTKDDTTKVWLTATAKF